LHNSSNVLQRIQQTIIGYFNNNKVDIAIAVTIREEVISSPYFETLSAPNYLNKDISRISNLSKASH